MFEREEKGRVEDSKEVAIASSTISSSLKTYQSSLCQDHNRFDKNQDTVVVEGCLPNVKFDTCPFSQRNNFFFF